MRGFRALGIWILLGMAIPGARGQSAAGLEPLAVGTTPRPRWACTAGDSVRIAEPADPWLSSDKGAHFAASAFIAALAYYAARREEQWRDAPSQRFAIGISLSAGIGKELWDWLGRHRRVSWKDLLADAVGLTTGLALVRMPDGTILEGGR